MNMSTKSRNARLSYRWFNKFSASFSGGGARFSNAYFSEFSGANYTKFGHDKKILFWDFQYVASFRKQSVPNATAVENREEISNFFTPV